MSVTAETTAPVDQTKVAPDRLLDILRTRALKILPLMGIGVAVIINAAWIGFLGYCLLKLI